MANLGVGNKGERRCRPAKDGEIGILGIRISLGFSSNNIGEHRPRWKKHPDISTPRNTPLVAEIAPFSKSVTTLVGFRALSAKAPLMAANSLMYVYFRLSGRRA